MIQKQGHWVPYELKPRTTASTAEKERFFASHRIVTGDEKWIPYDNPKRRKSWGKPTKINIFIYYYINILKINIFKLHLWLHINKTFIKIYFKYKYSLRRTKQYFFSQNLFILCKNMSKNLVFEIGHEGTKLITFITKENLFKGIKF
ncbi:MOS1T transposase, partial [Pseudoatta argentina]